MSEKQLSWVQIERPEAPSDSGLQPGFRTEYAKVGGGWLLRSYNISTAQLRGPEISAPVQSVGLVFIADPSHEHTPNPAN